MCPVQQLAALGRRGSRDLPPETPSIKCRPVVRTALGQRLTAHPNERIKGQASPVCCYNHREAGAPTAGVCRSTRRRDSIDAQFRSKRPSQRTFVEVGKAPLSSYKGTPPQTHTHMEKNKTKTPLTGHESRQTHPSGCKSRPKPSPPARRWIGTSRWNGFAVGHSNGGQPQSTYLTTCLLTHPPSRTTR